MKDIKLVERKPSERLIKLVDAIPELEIRDGSVVFKDVYGNGSVIYEMLSGCVKSRYNYNLAHYNPLRNVDRLVDFINEGKICITEESFCDLLEQHLYLTAKEKLEELLPQIQEHYPEAKIVRNDKEEFLTIFVGGLSVINTSRKFKWELNVTGRNSHIWEDKENLIVKKPKPWWETQGYYYKIYINDAVVPAKMSSCQSEIYSHNIKKVGKNAGVKTFKTKQEAQAMCNKLNAVLKGE